MLQGNGLEADSDIVRLSLLLARVTRTTTRA
jgi:hypothetical protein